MPDQRATDLRVVVGHEEQYCVRPGYREPPVGRRGQDTEGSKEKCLGHIDQVWSDMRPLSARTMGA